MLSGGLCVPGFYRKAHFEYFSDLGTEPGPCYFQSVVPKGLHMKLNPFVETPTEVALVL